MNVVANRSEHAVHCSLLHVPIIQGSSLSQYRGAGQNTRMQARGITPSFYYRLLQLDQIWSIRSIYIQFDG